MGSARKTSGMAPGDDAGQCTSIARLAALLRGRRVAVLTGAGCSTESGIPDYRGPETRKRARNPIRYNAFISDDAARRRYWARAAVGWRRFSCVAPNDGHHALADLERAGVVNGVITQNVDRLHTRAGSRRVVELHGALAEVVCLWCGELEARDSVQARLEALNPRHLRGAESVEIAPDGDAELVADEEFVVATCRVCGGVLKPRVVYFGESCEPDVVQAAFAVLDEADALLAVGTSLAVYSGLRFVRRARADGKVTALVNLGPTERGMDLFDVRVDRAAGAALTELRDALV